MFSLEKWRKKKYEEKMKQIINKNNIMTTCFRNITLHRELLNILANLTNNNEY